MLTLEFELTEDLKRIIEHSRDSQEHEATFGQLYETKYHKGGKIVETKDGFPDPGNIDKTKIPAALWLVKDHGVYLMSNGNPRMEPGNPDCPNVVYAKGHGPKKDEDWWVPGDDFAEPLPLEWFLPHLQKEGPVGFRIHLSEEQVRFEVFTPDLLIPEDSATPAP